MQFSLRSMLLATSAAPPVLAWLWMACGYYLIYFLLLVSIYLGAVVLILDDRS